MSLKCGGVIDDFTIFEVAANTNGGGIDSTIETTGPNFKPKVKTVPLYRPSKRSSVTRASVDSCHIAIEEMAGGTKGKFILMGTILSRDQEKKSPFLPVVSFETLNLTYISNKNCIF